MFWSATPPPPSVHDTHCEGAGLDPSTREWSYLYKLLKRWDYMGYGINDSRQHATILPPRVDLRGKNVLVSGGNTGLGFESASVFALWGAHVVLACRPVVPKHEQQPIKAREEIIARGKGSIKSEDVELWDVDMSSMNSVYQLGKRWMETGRTLDILVNNAGLVAPKYIVTEDGYELSRSVNYLSHCLLTLTVLPSMKEAKTPRIVNLCSCFHYAGKLDFANMDYEKSQGKDRGANGLQAYGDTKMYHLMWTKELQDRLSQSDEYRHIIVNGLHPGFANTGVWRAENTTAHSKKPTAMDKMLKHGLENTSVTAAHGCMCILYGALHSQFGLDDKTVESLGGDHPNINLPKGLTSKRGGNYISRTWKEEPLPECNDRLARSRLWQRTLEDVKAGHFGVLPVGLNHPEGVY